MNATFLVHVEEDQLLALDLALALESAGFRTWTYEVDNTAGTDDYVESILAAIRSSAIVVVVISPRALDKPEQVAREIYAGRGKPYIPVLYDLAADEYDEQVPRPWRETLGNSVMVEVRDDGIASAADAIVRGLRARVQPAGTDQGRLEGIRSVRDQLARRGGSRLRRWLVRQLAQGRRLLGRHPWATVVSAAALAAIVLRYAPVSDLYPRGLRARWMSGETPLNVWVTDAPALQDEPPTISPVRREYKRQLYSALTSAFQAAFQQKPEVHFIRDVEKNAEFASCASLPAGQRDGCVEKNAIARFDIHAKLDAALEMEPPSDLKTTLTITMVKGGALSGWDGTFVDDGNTLTTLAKQGATKVVMFLAPKTRPDGASAEVEAQIAKRIDLALRPEVDEKQIKSFEKTLGEFSAADDDDGPLGWLTRSAFAETAANPDEIRQVLGTLSKSLESRDAKAVTPLFVKMSDTQSRALQSYFDDMAPDTKLEVKFEEPVISVNGDTVSASFLRVDSFRDRDSNQPIRLAVQLVATLVKVDGQWKIQSLKRPS